MAVPTNPVALMNQIVIKTLPYAHRELDYWKKRAAEIPNKELRTQALSSIQHKTFHCEGGSIMALTALDQFPQAIRFIVAYQTISDYLDNLCDRSTSLDPKDFAALHEAMKDALTVGAKPREYYRYREDQEDGGYLVELMQTCQSVLAQLPNYKIIKPFLLELCDYYCDLQIHKHVCVEEREERLKNWFETFRSQFPDMEWYEFSACSGSTLGIFCLVSYAFRKDFQETHAQIIRNGYFPYIQGFHILLDYFIDQEEDRQGGDLNFCFYYKDNEHLFTRLLYFLDEANKQTALLPDSGFHKLINQGMLALYLSDEKVQQQKHVYYLSKKLIQSGGKASYFFYVHGRILRKVQSLFRKRLIGKETLAEV